MIVTLRYTQSVEKATRLTEEEVNQWREEALAMPPSRERIVDVFYLMLRMQRLVSYCGIDCIVTQTSQMKQFMFELNGMDIPLINLSAVPTKRLILPKVRLLKEWHPDIIEMLYGKVYSDIHLDPLFTGFNGAVFVQSNHIQDMCMAYELQVWSDARYNVAKVNKLRTKLKKLLGKINARDVHQKAYNETLLEVWDEKYESYKKALESLTNRLNNKYVKMYKGLGHPDPIVNAIFATTYTMAYLYKKFLYETMRALEHKYKYRLGKYLEEFGQMAEACKAIRIECDKVHHFNRNEMFNEDELPKEAWLKHILKDIRVLFEKEGFWQELIGDE